MSVLQVLPAPLFGSHLPQHHRRQQDAMSGQTHCNGANYRLLDNFHQEGFACLGLPEGTREVPARVTNMRHPRQVALFPGTPLGHGWT
mmetsp:Transcript_17362/g.40494  ORF Transcript_17362/g.40494 Transcript_17362/m.40494 type:complete len:88 (+) Transcript_17362:50-313(+)